MDHQIDQLSPALLWKHFQALCTIPRPSKQEEQVIQYVKQFGESQRLTTHVDKAGNVVITKPATPGMENRKAVVLQSHLDMVPQKNEGSAHQFEKDPVRAYIDGDWVTAEGTTLGADNGIGVATMLALLESTDIPHPRLEALFTVDEETGMTGAFQLPADFISGDILLNLDSEEEGTFVVGCAGGMNATGTLDFKPAPAPQGYLPLKISLTGLTGGHSGMDIHKERGNANKLLNRLLWELVKDLHVEVADIQGGDLRNAIPREAFATIVVDKQQVKQVDEYTSTFLSIYQQELKAVDPDIQLEVQETSAPASIIPKPALEKFLRIIYGIPHGVMRKDPEMLDVVETSNNLASVVTQENKLMVLNLMRSAVDSIKQDVSNRIRSVFELGGASVEEDSAYPGWQPESDSEILSVMKTVYEKQYNAAPQVELIHAGLECGIIKHVFPHLDCISFGPVIQGAHSPDERVHIPSVERFWHLLTASLREIPPK